MVSTTADPIGAAVRVGRAVLLALAALAGGACELARTTVPTGQKQLVVHAVLNPLSDYYTILVEESLTGRVTVDTTQHQDAVEPIVSSGGIAVSGAVVSLTRVSNGEVATGKEDAEYRLDHRGHGVYRFRNTGKGAFAPPDSVRNYLAIVRGTRYTLRVTKDGRVVSGATTVPEPGRGVPQVQGRPLFNRDHDSLVIDFPSVVSAARALLRISTPYGPFSLFSDSARVVVPGTLRNAFAEGFPSAFVPGFESTVLLAAVDTNYFDYYRSINSPFTGTGLITHLRGGSGVFGSMLPLDTRRLDVTADYTHPLDGRYVGGATGRDTLEIWVDDEVRNGSLVSGSLRTVTAGGFVLQRAAVLGALTGDLLSLRVFETESAPAFSGTARVEAGVLTFATSRATLTFRRIAR